jgi:hypothetical protein
MDRRSAGRQRQEAHSAWLCDGCRLWRPIHAACGTDVTRLSLRDVSIHAVAAVLR